MNAIVIEHVNVNELPEPWRLRLATKGDAQVTVRIEEETSVEQPDSAFGMWSNHASLADVATYVRHLRSPRFDRK